METAAGFTIGEKNGMTRNSQENAVAVNDYRFKITDAGKKLSCADATYELNERPQTIVIDKDGKTRKQAGT